MARGQLEQRVEVRSSDEIGELAGAFNQMSAELTRSNQARRQMTADIAHDLRTPLTVIAGYVEALRDQVLAPTTERFTTIYSEVLHLQRLVEDLRTLSLADAGELKLFLQPVAPRELLERVAAAYAQQAEERRIELKVEAESSLPEVNLDPERMEQALGNLVSNALRYTPEGGEISLVAEQVAGYLTVSVQDNGSGIPPEILPQVFERSYRGDPARSGNESGLGLAIVKSIVELHGGSITAASQLGAGSCFSLTLRN
jgi:signal transduction histidine kinase